MGRKNRSKKHHPQRPKWLRERDALAYRMVLDARQEGVR